MINRSATFVVALVACVPASLISSEGGDGAPPGLRPIGREAFEAVVRFYDYDKTIPLEARVVERKETASTVRRKIVFRGVRGFLVPGYLEIPLERSAPCAVILLLHGWSGSKESWWQDDGYISGGNLRQALLADGHAVLALDAVAHGDRIAENGYALVNDHREEGAPTHRNYFTMEEIFSQTVIEYRRALDYLETRDDVDTKRVGVAGYSMGGNQTFLLNAVEPRVKASVCCVVPSMVGRRSSVSPKDYARGVGERPFLMLMGKTDSMCLEEHARQLLDLVPGTRKELIFYDAGHRLPAAYVKDARAWFVEYLK